MHYHLPNIPSLGILETPAGLAVLSHEHVLAGNDPKFYSRFPDATGRFYYQVYKQGPQARVEVLDSRHNLIHRSDIFDSWDLARAAIVQALITSTQEMLERITHFIPEEILGIQARNDAA